MTSAIRDAILAALVEPRTRDELVGITGWHKVAVCEAVSILIARGAVREVGPGPVHRLELVASPRPTMLEELRALAPADRAVVLECTAAVARSVVDDLEAARAGATGPFHLHTCDVLGLATALLFTLEQLAARDQPPAPVAPELDDATIRAARDEARFAGDQETARLCSAALGLEIGDGARGRLDRDECRARLAEIIRTTRYPATARKDPAP